MCDDAILKENLLQFVQCGLRCKNESHRKHKENDTCYG